MATTNYGVTPSDVKGKLPIDSGAIQPTGGRLSDADLMTFIGEASGIVTGWLTRSGRTADGLDGDARAAVGAAIEAYAGMQALLKLGNGESGTKYQAFKRRYETEERKWTQSPQLFSGAPTTAESNVPADALPSHYTRSSFSGW